MRELSQSIEINARAEDVFRVVSDLPAMGRFSPENTGGEWVGATGPALGAKFRGTNVNGTSSWSTMSRIVEFTPPSAFAFEVTVGPSKVSRWSYAIEPTATGCRVRESWIDRRNALSRWASARSTGLSDRASFTERSIRETLGEAEGVLRARCVRSNTLGDDLPRSRRRDRSARRGLLLVGTIRGSQSIVGHVAATRGTRSHDRPWSTQAGVRDARGGAGARLGWHECVPVRHVRPLAPRALSAVAALSASPFTAKSWLWSS